MYVCNLEHAPDNNIQSKLVTLVQLVRESNMKKVADFMEPA